MNNEADLILISENIFTGLENRPFPGYVALEGDRILKTGKGAVPEDHVSFRQNKSEGASAPSFFCAEPRTVLHKWGSYKKVLHRGVLTPVNSTLHKSRPVVNPHTMNLL